MADFRPARALGVEVRIGARDANDALADVVDRNRHPGPLVGVVYEPCFDAIGERVANLLQDGTDSIKGDAVGGCASEHFLWPISVALDGVCEQAIALLQKARQLAPGIGQHLMDMRREHLHGMKHDAALRRDDRRRVPIDLLQRLVRIRT